MQSNSTMTKVDLENYEVSLGISEIFVARVSVINETLIVLISKLTNNLLVNLILINNLLLTTGSRGNPVHGGLKSK